MIQRMSDQHKISFLTPESLVEETPKETATSPSLQQIAKEQKAKKLNNKDNGYMTNNHISSAVTGEITNQGAPRKFIGSETANSILDSDKISNVAAILDSKERVTQQKEQIATNKRTTEEKRMNELIEAINNTEQRQDASVSPLNTYSGSGYPTSRNNMSIFDSEDFQRLAEKSAGEELSKKVEEKRNQKDESWKNSGKAVSSKDISKLFMDGLSG